MNFSLHPLFKVFQLGALFCWLSTFVLPVGMAGGAEITGDLSMEGLCFPEDGGSPGQKESSTSVAANFEFHHDFSDTLSLDLAPFYRHDFTDRERSHGDLREASLLYLAEKWELTVGLGKVFWGATEFVHLVDIINQTDLVEALDGEEKLGQPMLHVLIPEAWGTLEGFLLPWFRERTFPGEKGRFRTPVIVDTDNPLYESSSEEHHLDLALRYSTSFAIGDIGLYYFQGTARDPVLLFSSDSLGAPFLIPYYQQIGQTGIDLQMVLGRWLLKGEALYRTGQSRSFAATTIGFEYTLVGLAGTMMDLGWIGEYVFDDRDKGWLPIIYDHDLMGGLRLSVNDADDSTLLLGVIHDLDYGSTIIALEASRRLNNTLRLNLDGSFFLNIARKDPAYSLVQDNYIKLEIVWYF